MSKSTDKQVSRRRFLGQTAATAAGVVAAPYVITSPALGAEGRPPASDRIVMGGIGLGGRGSSDLKWAMLEKEVQFVAVCEVRRKRRDVAKNAIDRKYRNEDCQTYRDMREILARPDIDAMLIATGDRWHAPASILAMNAGGTPGHEQHVVQTFRPETRSTTITGT